MTFLDANIFMYAAGRTSPQKQACENLLIRMVKGVSKNKYCTDTEVLQEILYRYLSLNCPQIGFDMVENIWAIGITVLPVENQSMKWAKSFLQLYKKISVRDSVHLGVMKSHSLSEMATYDSDFLQVDWVKIITPK